MVELKKFLTIVCQIPVAVPADQTKETTKTGIS